jgi:aconitate hydratase
MHQINLERMSPVVHAKDGVAYPDTLVGTDSHTPHVDALGVIAIGVGGLEAESVMLGRASWMRLPDIVGVELTGKPQPDITATDIVLALTEFLRKEKVVGAYLEFHGEGADSRCETVVSELSQGRPTLVESDFTGGDQALVDHLQKAAVLIEKIYAKQTGLWADALKTAEYERVLKFDLSTVVRNMAGPSVPHRRLPTSDLPRARHRAKWGRCGPDAGRRGDHRGDHQLRQHQQWRNVIAAGRSGNAPRAD